MNKLFGLALLLSAVIACDKPDPSFDQLAMNPDLSSSKGIAVKVKHTFQPADSDTSEALRGVFYDASGGVTVEEGAAGIVVVVPLFEDGKQMRAIGGGLKITSSAPDVMDLQLLPKEDRRIVLLGKKVGHVDVTFTVDGVAGSRVVGVDVIPLTPVTP